MLWKVRAELVLRRSFAITWCSVTIRYQNLVESKEKVITELQFTYLLWMRHFPTSSVTTRRVCMAGATNWWRTYSFRKIYIVLRTWQAKLQKMHNWLYDLTTRQYALLYNHGRDSCLSGSGIYATMKCNVLITDLTPSWILFCLLLSNARLRETKTT